MKPRALLLENIHPDAADRLAEAGFAVTCRPAQPRRHSCESSCRGWHCWACALRTKVTAAALERADCLLAIGSFCVGTGNVDLSAASDRGVAVFNAPYSNT